MSAYQRQRDLPTALAEPAWPDRENMISKKCRKKSSEISHKFRKPE
jgi:hypothetical protein